MTDRGTLRRTRIGRTPRCRQRRALYAAAALCVGAACAPGAGDAGLAPGHERGTDASGIAYVESGACAACHPAQQAAWAGSHHDLAMQPATAETVLGDFNDAAITHFGVTSRFFTRGGRFYVNTEGPDGALADFELTYTFGAEPLQQYLSPFPGGRLQSLTIAWDSARGAWFPLYPDARIPPGDPLHWTGRSQNWNGMCAECHSTNLRKHYDPDTDTYRTRWDEIDVGCQACHGPGAAHVAWARSAPGDAGGGARAAGLTVDLASAPARTEIETCAGCHSRRQRLDDGTHAGQPFLDGFRPSTLAEGLYHADGQIQGEVYVWGSYVQSRMYAAGVRCSHCHDPHGLEIPAGDNAVCVQCHAEVPAPAFPTLAAKRYDTPLHHFHAEGSEGALCVNCHMPAQTYMIVDPRRDHSFRIPRPDVSARHGTPNACTNCHADRDAAWAAAQAAAWWGAPQNPAHFADAIAAGRRADRGAAPQLLALLEDTGNAAIVRATALDLLVPEGAGAGDAIAAATADPDPLVRTAAAAALDRLPPQPRIAAAGPLLEDPARTVRIGAARVLASVDPAALGGRRDHQSRAFSDYVAAQLASADMPAARLNLGVAARRAGRPQQAAREYEAALRLDPGFLPARFNLANLYNQLGRNDEAEAVLRNGLRWAPDEGELHYSLGLVLAEERRLEDAATHLQRAAERIERSRVRYNYGLVLERLGRLDEAETALLAAHAGDARDPDVLWALTQLLLDREDFDRAQTYARALLSLNPTAPGPQRLLNEIQIRQRRRP